MVKRRKLLRKKGSHELAVRKKIEAEPVCGVSKVQGGVCMLPPGFGTDHPGQGSCMYHDTFQTTTRRRPGSRYAKGIADSALEHYLEMADDPEIKKLDDEIALLRSNLLEMQEMVREIQQRNDDSHFHLAHGPKLDPAATADQKALLQLMRDTARMSESISKLIDRKHKMEEGKIVTYRQVQEVLAQVIYTIHSHCEGCAKLDALAEDFARIDVLRIAR
jgi:hypothetical protein